MLLSCGRSSEAQLISSSVCCCRRSRLRAARRRRCRSPPSRGKTSPVLTRTSRGSLPIATPPVAVVAAPCTCACAMRAAVVGVACDMDMRRRSLRKLRQALRAHPAKSSRRRSPKRAKSCRPLRLPNVRSCLRRLPVRTPPRRPSRRQTQPRPPRLAQLLRPPRQGQLPRPRQFRYPRGKSASPTKQSFRIGLPCSGSPMHRPKRSSRIARLRPSLAISG